MFSPDGRFVAYVSNESGRDEIYVQTFPDAGGRWQVSNGGGSDPSWRGDGKELYYRSPDQKLMAVEIRGGSDFQAGVPQGLFVPPSAARQSAQQVRGFGRRPEVPRRRPARPRLDEPDDDRPELA